MLTISDSVLLLLENEDGTFAASQSESIASVLAGAVLLDLSLAGRIDTDMNTLFVLDETPTGNILMDRVLSEIRTHPESADTVHWIETLSASPSISIQELALASLVQSGVVGQKEYKFAWSSHHRIYSLTDLNSKENVKKRLRDVILCDDIPDPADAAAACLVDACGLLPEILSDSQIKQCQPRMRILRRLELIGREVINRIASIERKQILQIRARTARRQNAVFGLSVVACVTAVATVVSPRVPIPDQFGPTLLEYLWNDSFWQQWTGYLLLGLSLLGILIIVVLKYRLLSQWASYSAWQFFHVLLGILCVLTLFAHTGFRLGANLNALLMLSYLAVLIVGAAAGILIGGASGLGKRGLSVTKRIRKVPVKTHFLFLLPLPALLVVHILIVYLY
ncbi:MAG: GPP34 family phosphoprotein [Acidiferrobacterales bacterium]|nr:GPP34 family phosphoprotein [Acidiferrobacterales bacterium]